MIDGLAVAKSAVFFEVKEKITKKSINNLFVDLRKRYGVTGNDIFRSVKDFYGKSVYSSICFIYEKVPPFFSYGSSVKDVLCGYLLIVEYKGYSAVFSSRISLPSTFKTQHFSAVPVNLFESGIAREGAVFESMKLRNMSISRYAMREKTLDATNLETASAPQGNSRYVPRGYTVSIGGVHKSGTPGSGRVRHRSPRVMIDDVIAFAEGTIDDFLDRDAGASPFIRRFARQIPLQEAVGDSQPASMIIDAVRLLEALEDKENGYLRKQPLQDDLGPAFPSRRLTAEVQGSFFRVYALSPGGRRPIFGLCASC